MYITQTQRVTYLVPVNLHNKETKHEFLPEPMRIIYIKQVHPIFSEAFPPKKTTMRWADLHGMEMIFGNMQFWKKQGAKPNMYD